jgi:hypothetical protein
VSFFGAGFFGSGSETAPGTPRNARRRGEFITRVRQTGDMVGATVDWPTDWVLNLGANVLRSEWEHVLRVAPYRRVGRRTVTTDANGRFPWTALHINANADNAEYAHTILEMRTDQKAFEHWEPSHVWNLSTLSDDFAGYSGYSVIGDEVQVIGAGSNATLTVLVNHTPQYLDLLITDESVVDYPEGWEPVLWLETAALCLIKGGREASAAMDLRRQAEDLRQRLLQVEARRRSSAPKILQARDDASEWGSW